MAAGLGKVRHLGSHPSICKLKRAYYKKQFLNTLWSLMKETSFFRIYIGIVYGKGDVFLRRKLGILVLMVLLGAAVVGSQKAGEYLYQNYMADKEVQTAAEVKAGGKQVVVVDAGHGGWDPGKVGINKALEKDLNLQVAKKVKANLEKQGFAVIMTREDENELADTKAEDLKKRVSIINEAKPAMAVSIHQNSYPEESIHGAQVFYYTHSKSGENAAKVMQEALLSVDPENKRQAKANDTYYMLKKTEVPVIIIECGFLSNSQEADKLVDDKYQQTVADAICEGIKKNLSNQVNN